MRKQNSKKINNKPPKAQGLDQSPKKPSDKLRFCASRTFLGIALFHHIDPRDPVASANRLPVEVWLHKTHQAWHVLDVAGDWRFFWQKQHSKIIKVKNQQLRKLVRNHRTSSKPEKQEPWICSRSRGKNKEYNIPRVPNSQIFEEGKKKHKKNLEKSRTPPKQTLETRANLQHVDHSRHPNHHLHQNNKPPFTPKL